MSSAAASHLVARLGRVGDLDSADGERASSGQSVSEELADQSLLAAARGVDQAVEGRGLVFWQPYEERRSKIKPEARLKSLKKLRAMP